MNTTPLNIPDIRLIKPQLHEDHRGYFFESYHQEKFAALGITDTFVQDNQSRSQKGTLRGLHLQTGDKAQSKLLRVLEGEIFDVAVDIRPNSPTFGQWASTILTADNKHMLYVPRGFAHGFYVLSDMATLFYKCDNLYAPEAEQTLQWDDPSVAIEWPIHPDTPTLLSPKDQQGSPLNAFR